MKNIERQHWLEESMSARYLLAKLQYDLRERIEQYELESGDSVSSVSLARVSTPDGIRVKGVYLDTLKQVE